MTSFLAGFWPFRASSPTVSSPPETLAPVSEPPTPIPVRTAPFDSAQIAIKLRPFGISEAELDHLSSVIKSDEALEQMLSLLKANRRQQLDQLIGPLADQWSNSTKQNKKVLLACQALVGMAVVHPAFESVCGLAQQLRWFRRFASQASFRTWSAEALRNWVFGSMRTKISSLCCKEDELQL